MRKTLNVFITAIIIICFIVLAVASGTDATPSNTPAPAPQQEEPSERGAEPEATPDPTPQAPAGVEVPDGGIVMFDDDDMIVTITGVSRNRDGFVTEISFLIENNGDEERAIETLNNSFITKAVMINNISIQAGISTTVAAGKAARETMRIDNDDATLFEIWNVYEIAMQFETYTPDGFMRANQIEHELSTATVESSTFSDFNNGRLAFSNDYAEVFACDFSSGFLSDSVVFVIKNISDNDAHFRLESISVNGIMNDSTVGNGGNIFRDTYRVFRIMLDDDVDTRDINEIEFRLELGEFNDIVTFSPRDIGIVTITY